MKNLKILSVLILFFNVFQNCEFSRILIVHNTLTKSHIFPVQILASSLAEERHHNVTFISSYPIGEIIENLREIIVPYDKDDQEYISIFLDRVKKLKCLKLSIVFQKF